MKCTRFIARNERLNDGELVDGGPIEREPSLPSDFYEDGNVGGLFRHAVVEDESIEKTEEFIGDGWSDGIYTPASSDTRTAIEDGTPILPSPPTPSRASGPETHTLTAPPFRLRGTLP